MFDLSQNTESTITYFNDISLQIEEFPTNLVFKRPGEAVPLLKVEPKPRKSNSSRLYNDNKNKRVSFNFKET